MIKKLNIGVVGTGHLGKLHTKMFKEIENCNLVGINDSNMEQAKVVGKEFDVNVFESIHDLLIKVNCNFRVLIMKIIINHKRYFYSAALLIFLLNFMKEIDFPN